MPETGGKSPLLFQKAYGQTKESPLEKSQNRWEREQRNWWAATPSSSESLPNPSLRPRGMVAMDLRPDHPHHTPQDSLLPSKRIC